MNQLEASINGEDSLKTWAKILNGLGRVGEYIGFDVYGHELVVTAFNSSRSVFGLARFGKPFFKSYRYGPVSAFTRGPSSSHSIFQLQAKLLTAIFRLFDQEDKSVQLCRLSVVDHGQNDEELGSLSSMVLQIEMVCSNRIVKTYKLPCMDTRQAFQAGVDRNDAKNWFRCHTQTLRQQLDLMSPRVEVFQMAFDPDRTELVSYTTAIANEQGVLKQPLHTRIMIQVATMFDAMSVRSGLEIGVRFKEFRTFVNLADSIHHGENKFEAFFFQPGYPLMVELSEASAPTGVQLEFVFLTTGTEPEDESQGYITRGSKIPVRIAEPVAESNGATHGASMASQLTTQLSTAQLASLNAASQSVADLDVNMDEPTADYSASVGWDDGAFEHDDEALDAELATLGTERHEDDGIGPTQGASQARGLFDS